MEMAASQGTFSTPLTGSVLEDLIMLINDDTVPMHVVMDESHQVNEEVMEVQEFVEKSDMCMGIMWYGKFHDVTGFQPCSIEWPGDHVFSISILSESAGKTSWQYSSRLNQVFIPMDSSLPIRFKCLWHEPDLNVRALPVFLSADDLHEPVTRCSLHMDDKQTNTNLDFPYPAHVVRCENMDSCYLEDPVSKRLSVLTPLGSPPPGTDYVVQHYRFMCKTSCMGGMNRRPIQLIFTLERQTGEVIGRAAVKVRICSCPKRDLNKAEEVPKSALPCSVPHKPKKMKRKMEVEKCVRYIPIFGDENLWKECAKILRTQLIGPKIIVNLPLNAEEKENLNTFNSIIGDMEATVDHSLSN